jgi:hypothetical protein
MWRADDQAGRDLMFRSDVAACEEGSPFRRGGALSELLWQMVERGD